MEALKLNDRLMTATGFVREGSRFADVGTDHAYLPIYLMCEGKIASAIASDVNEGPLERAEANIKKHGLSDKISTALCDGLCGLEKYDPDDVAIFGMGGELIVRIIDEASWLKDTERKKRIIVQPMTHVEKVREYFAENGFYTVGEELSLDRGKIYQTICVEYDGIKRSFDDLTLMLGENIIEKRGPLFDELAHKLLKQMKRRISGKSSAGESTLYEQGLVESLLRLMEEKK